MTSHKKMFSRDVKWRRSWDSWVNLLFLTVPLPHLASMKLHKHFRDVMARDSQINRRGSNEHLCWFLLSDRWRLFICKNESNKKQIFIRVVHKIFNLILWSTAHQTERTYPLLRERSMDGTIKLEKEEIPRSIQGHFMNFRRKLFHSHFAFIRNIFRLKWMERNKIARRNEKFIWNDFSHRHELKFSSSQDEERKIQCRT